MRRLVFVLTAFILLAGQATALAAPMSKSDREAISKQREIYGFSGDPTGTCGVDSGSSGNVVLTGSDNQQQAFNFFVSKGLSQTVSAAIAGNFLQESSMNPKSNQSGGPGMGIAQWSNPGRWNNLEQAEGDKRFTLGAQLDFVWKELNGVPPAGDYSSVLKKMKELANDPDIFKVTGYFMGTSAVNDPDAAANEFMSKYGRVSGYENPGTPALGNRVNYAKAILQKYGNGVTTASGADGTTVDTAAVTGADASCGSIGAVTCSDTGATPPADGLSQIRQNVVCLTKAELAKWNSGEMKPGGSYLTYTQGRNEEWCADFVSWIYNNAGYPLSGAPGGNVAAVAQVKLIGLSGGKFTYHAAGSYIPVPGDIVIYQVGMSHMNIVVSVNQNTKSMTVIGGNQGGISNNSQSLVSQNNYSGFTGHGITGYVSPTGTN